MALRSEKTRSALAELGVMENMMRAAAAHVGNLWPLWRQKSKTELVKASVLDVSTSSRPGISDFFPRRADIFFNFSFPAPALDFFSNFRKSWDRASQGWGQGWGQG